MTAAPLLYPHQGYRPMVRLAQGHAGAWEAACPCCGRPLLLDGRTLFWSAAVAASVARRVLGTRP